MKRYIALLRGINVSGQKLIKMEALREYFVMPGFKNITTYIQSGNVLFDAKEQDEAVLRKKIETQLLKKLGYAVPTIVRSIEDVQKVISNNPFKQVLTEDTRKLYVTFLSDTPPADAMDLLKKYLNEQEEIHIIGKDLYFVTVAFGNTKLNNSVIEKKLGVSATARNWATVNKITAL